MASGQLNENWNDVCNRIRNYEGVDVSQVNAFFSRLEPQAMSEGFLMLTADNDFIKGWIEIHYLDLIKRALNDLFNVPFTVIIEVNPVPQKPANVASADTGERRPVENTQSFPPIGGGAAGGAGAAGAGAGASAGGAGAGMAYAQGAGAGGYQGGAGVSQNYSGNGAAGGTYQDASGADGANFSHGAWHEAQNSAGMPFSNASAYDNSAHFDRYVEYEDLRSKVDFSQGTSTREIAEEDHDALPASSLKFENFVIGDSNRMAYSMAVEVAENPGTTPLNPLFIYGKSGLGKTHLMRAIQNYIRETRPYLRTVYVDSAELLSDYMDASVAHDKEKSSYRNFKTRYEAADVLLIDDIQYLQGKKQTLDIVFQIFNKLTMQGKQIVLSADRAPKNIDIDERYHSRFNQGGTIDIQPPEIETKLGIVKSFINEYRKKEGLGHFYFAEDIQMYIAENSSSNIRELKSAVTKVIYQITYLDRHDLTVEDVRILLENHFSGGSSKNLTVEDIQREIETFYKVKRSDLVGPKRARNIVYPRQIAIYLCRQLLDLPYNDIGKKFNRDHTTAMHSVATVEEMMQNNREVQEEIETLKQIIRES